MSEYFIVEYGKAYQLCNRNNFVYCVILKDSGTADRIISLLENEYHANVISQEEYNKVKAGEK